MNTMNVEQWGSWLAVLAVMAMAPLLLTMVTSFAKLAIVGSLIRTGLGTPQIPPTIVITGLSMILTIYVMWPVGAKIAGEYARLQAQHAQEAPAQGTNAEAALDGDRPALAPGAVQANGWITVGDTRVNWKWIAQATQEPMRDFLRRHSSEENRQFFSELLARLKETQGEQDAANPSAGPATESVLGEAVILVPAFMLTELTAAFQIGLLILIPFLVVDLVVSTILLALGAQMLQPTVIALPLKIGLFVLVGGWRVIYTNVLASCA